MFAFATAGRSECPAGQAAREVAVLDRRLFRVCCYRDAIKILMYPRSRLHLDLHPDPSRPLLSREWRAISQRRGGIHRPVSIPSAVELLVKNESVPSRWPMIMSARPLPTTLPDSDSCRIHPRRCEYHSTGEGFIA